MKQKLAKIKNILNTKEFVMRAFFVSFLLVFLMFLSINQFSIQFWANGFLDVFKSELQVYFLDVGQANSTLIVFPNKMAMLVDAGCQDTQNQLLENVEYILDKNNIDEIEYLILTHSDEDHVGGTEIILQNFQVCNILRPKVLASFEQEQNGYQYITTDIFTKTMAAVFKEENCTTEFINDKVFNFENVKVEIFSCQLDVYSDTNSYSPFVLIEYNDKSILLTGDATAKREKEFVNLLKNENREIDIDYLLLSHHGSKYSSTEDFLSFVKADYAIASCLEEYYPAVEVKERLFDSGVEKIYNTRDNGTIALTVDKTGSEIKYFAVVFDIPFVFVCACVVCFVYLKFPCVKKIKFRQIKQLFSLNFAKK